MKMTKLHKQPSFTYKDFPYLTRYNNGKFFASDDGNLDQTVEDERETEYKAEGGVKAGPKDYGSPFGIHCPTPSPLLQEPGFQ